MYMIGVKEGRFGLQNVQDEPIVQALRFQVAVLLCVALPVWPTLGL